MTKVLGKYARFYLGHHNIYLKSFEATQNLETKIVDATNYAQDFEESEVLQAQGTFELTARLENTYRGSGDADAVYSPIATVDGAQTASDTEIEYTSSGNPVSAGEIILVGGVEKMLVLLVDETNNVLKVQRGYSDTTPVVHQSPAAVNITSSSVANPTVITTAAVHGLVTGDVVLIAGHSGSTPDINGIHTVTVLTTTTFTIPVNVTVGGTGGTSTELVQIIQSGDRLLDKLLYEEAMAPSGVISNTPVPMSLVVRKTPAVGDLAQMFKGLPSLTFSSPVADLASMRCSVKETGAVDAGQVLAIGSKTIVQGTPQYGQSNGVQLGKVWKAARFVYHVYSLVVNVGAAPTLDITIERDDALAMPTKADYATLEAALSGVKGEWNQYTTTTTDDFWRVRFDVNGSVGDQITIGIVVIGYVE